jgi:hypothetical protein
MRCTNTRIVRLSRRDAVANRRFETADVEAATDIGVQRESGFSQTQGRGDLG